MELSIAVAVLTARWLRIGFLVSTRLRFPGEKADFVAVSAVKVAVEGGLAVNTAIGLNGPGA